MCVFACVGVECVYVMVYLWQSVQLEGIFLFFHFLGLKDRTQVIRPDRS